MFAAILLTLILLVLVLRKYIFIAKPKDFPPGPPNLPFVGAIPYFMKDGSLIQGIRRVVDQYGPISGVFFGNKPAVIIADYLTLKEVFKSEDAIFRPKIIPANFLRPGHEDLVGDNEGQAPGVILSNGDYWKEQRRFLLKNLKDFGFGRTSMESIIQEEVVKLCNKMSDVPQDEATDLNRMLNISILNALWGILVGEKLDLDDQRTLGFLAKFDKFLRENGTPISPIVAILPRPEMATWPVLDQIFGFKFAKLTFDDAISFIRGYVENHKKTFEPDNIRDFTDLMLSEINQTTDPKSSFYGKTGENALLNDLVDMFLAGMETTSSSLMWTFLYMIHHPDIQERVHKELDDVVGRNRFPSLDDRPKLHLLNAVLQEGLRVSSLIGPGVPHRAVRDFKVGNYVIPKDTTIFGSLYHIMNDPKYFPDPHKFKPDRFLDDNGHFQVHERVVPFGIGRRICLGQTLADKEFYLFFAGFMQQFKLRHAPRTTLPSYDISKSFPKDIIRPAPQYFVNLVHRFK